MPSRRPRYTASTVDPYVLYQLSVQAPENDVHFLDRVFRNTYGRRPLHLREDFCGTGLLCKEWVLSRRDRTATGVDLDDEVLAWGRRNNVEALGEDAWRVKLERANVLETRQRADIVVAFNFSYWILTEREEMVRYFTAVRSCLKAEGLFVCDMFGGPDAQCVMEERKSLPGFEYVWEQATFNPLDHHMSCKIHFEFPDGTNIRPAFTYDWRLWSTSEIRDCLREAGFSRSEVYWEGTDRKTMEGNGVFTRRKKVENEQAWVSYMVAHP